MAAQSEFVTEAFDQVAAHGGSQTHPGSPLSLKAPAGAQASKNLVKVTLEDWDGDQDHIYLGHSDPLESVKATFATEVVILWARARRSAVCFLPA